MSTHSRDGVAIISRDHLPKAQLRHYVEIDPPTAELKSVPQGDPVTFMSLDTVWADGHADVTREMKWTGQAHSYTPFRRGDVLLPKVSPTFSMGRATVANIPHNVGLASSEVYVLRPRTNVDSRFVAYAVRTSHFLDEGTASQQGVGGLRRVSSGWVGAFNFPRYDLPTQRRIADYLDRETAQIDTMAEALDGLVARLKERHSAVITHHVMKGITQENRPSLSNSSENSPLGPTDHLPMVQLRHYAEISPPTPEFTFTAPGSIVTFMPLETVWPNGHAKVDGEITWSGEAHSYVPFRRGDVLLPKVSPTFSMGRATVANTPHPIGLASSEVYVLRPRTKADARFISYAVRSTDFLAEGTSSQQGVGGLRRVTSGWVGSFKLPQYSLDEQRRIADYLDAETAKIDAMIAKAGGLRALLDERRSALITATVTGQHPVPEEH